MVIEYFPPTSITSGMDDTYDYGIIDGRGGSAQARATIRLSPDCGNPPTAPGATASEHQRILALIPNEAVKATCRPQQDGQDSPGELGEILCDFEGVSVYYQSYDSAASAHAAWDRYSLPPIGNQAEGCDGTRFWYEGTYTDTGTANDGSLRCYREVGTQRVLIFWTDDSHRVFAVAQRGDGNVAALYSTWREKLGPTG